MMRLAVSICLALMTASPAWAQESPPPEERRETTRAEPDEGRDASVMDEERVIDQAGERPGPLGREGPGRRLVDERSLRFRLFGGYRYEFERNLKGTNGDVTAQRAAGGVGVDVPIGDFTTLSLGFLGEYNEYEFDETTIFDDPLGPGAGGDPFSEYLRLVGGATLSFRIDETWSAFVGFDVEDAGELGEGTNDSTLVSGGGGIGWRPSDDLTIGAGIYIQERLEDDNFVRPLIRIDWQIDEKTRLSTIGPTPFGPGALLERQLADGWYTSLRALYERREFRLGDEAISPEGILKDEQFTLGVGLIYSPDARMRAAVTVGGVLYQEFELEDRNGTEVADVETDPALFLEATLTLRF